MINLDQFKAGANFKLNDYSTKLAHPYSKDQAQAQLSDVRKDLARFQERLFAHGGHSVLVCFQGMDTSGKDSLIREVFEKFNVRGVIQHSFKVPTSLELSHGYLWRHYIALPQKGTFGIFNRTHYENVLVTRVHPEYLLAENLPDVKRPEDADAEFWEMRFEQINNFEKELTQNGTIVFKFFLNLSKEEQKNRLLRRLNTPEKNYKFSAGDIKERKLWDDYMHAYEQAISNTSKEHAPWYVIPADDKANARLLVAQIMDQRLSHYDHIQEPELSPEEIKELKGFVSSLENE